MTILTKQIKPKRLNDKAFFEEFEKAAKVISKEMKKEFEITTIGWDTDVKFEELVSLGPTSIDILVATDNEIYGYVNNGTVPHVIAAKKGKTLAFRWGGPGSYRAKTARGKQVHNPAGGQTSGNMIFPKAVQHPGTKAREFDKLIKKMFEKKFTRAMELALKKGVARSGHAMK